MYLFMKFTAIKEIEHLHHNKCIENKCKVSGIDPKLLINGHVIRTAINKIEPTTSNRPPNNSILPLILRMFFKMCIIIIAHVFGYEHVTHKN